MTQLQQLLDCNQRMYIAMQEMVALLKADRNDWIDTKSTLLLLRRKNSRILPYVRKNLLQANEWRMEGKNYEYMAVAIKRLREDADKGKILIPKNKIMTEAFNYAKRKDSDRAKAAMLSDKSAQEIVAIVRENIRIEQENKKMIKLLDDKCAGLKITREEFFNSKLFNRYC